MRAQGAFLGWAVRFLAADAAISQFLDIGTGIPASDNTLEVAQAVARAARVVYVDKDPVVLAHALLTGGLTVDWTFGLVVASVFAATTFGFRAANVHSTVFGGWEGTGSLRRSFGRFARPPSGCHLPRRAAANFLRVPVRRDGGYWRTYECHREARLLA